MMNKTRNFARAAVENMIAQLMIIIVGSNLTSLKFLIYVFLLQK